MVSKSRTSLWWSFPSASPFLPLRIYNLCSMLEIDLVNYLPSYFQMLLFSRDAQCLSIQNIRCLTFDTTLCTKRILKCTSHIAFKQAQCSPVSEHLPVITLPKYYFCRGIHRWDLDHRASLKIVLPKPKELFLYKYTQ